MDMRLEVVVIPVSDVDRAKRFYTRQAGFRLDADLPVDDAYRVVQVTPPGSECSIIFGTGLTPAEPGSFQGLHLIVRDIERATRELEERGVQVGAPFREGGGVFHRFATDQRVPGLHPDRASYGTFASFEDPDGNAWFLQEITQRAPGR
ncbi:VOC family protein [Spirillospora sp. NPDC052269]